MRSERWLLTGRQDLAKAEGVIALKDHSELFGSHLDALKTQNMGKMKGVVA